jgi:hypothetical protein
MITKQILLKTFIITVVATFCVFLLVLTFKLNEMIAFGSAIPIAIVLIWLINKVIKRT